jgi:hypothetical protein
VVGVVRGGALLDELLWQYSSLDLSQQQQVLRVSDVGFGEQLPVGQASVIVEVRRIEGEACAAVRGVVGLRRRR